MKVEIRLQASIDHIAAEAHRIADEVQRLRYLRRLVRRVPQAGWWGIRFTHAAMRAITGAATLIWQGFTQFKRRYL